MSNCKPYEKYRQNIKKRSRKTQNLPRESTIATIGVPEYRKKEKIQSATTGLVRKLSDEKKFKAKMRQRKYRERKKNLKENRQCKTYKNKQSLSIKVLNRVKSKLLDNEARAKAVVFKLFKSFFPNEAHKY